MDCIKHDFCSSCCYNYKDMMKLLLSKKREARIGKRERDSVRKTLVSGSNLKPRELLMSSHHREFSTLNFGLVVRIRNVDDFLPIVY